MSAPGQGGHGQLDPNTKKVIGYVFGYGSLADPDDWLIKRDRAGYLPSIYGHLSGYRRHWNLAMENGSSGHDHKYYVDVTSGERLAGWVATLGVEIAQGMHCNGVAVAVDDQRLAWFDQREGALYERVLLAASAFTPQLDLPLWTYIPAEAALANFQLGCRQDNVFLPEDYFYAIEELFAERGAQALAEYRASTGSPDCPLRKLALIRAPGDAGI